MAIHRSNDPKIAPYVGTLTANTTVGHGTGLVGVDTNGGTVTVTLAAGLADNTGYTLTVIDEGGFAGTNAITIATANGATVDGGTTATIGSNYGALSVYTNGTNYFTKSATSGGGTL